MNALIAPLAPPITKITQSAKGWKSLLLIRIIWSSLMKRIWPRNESKEMRDQKIKSFRSLIFDSCSGISKIESGAKKDRGEDLRHAYHTVNCEELIFSSFIGGSAAAAEEYSCHMHALIMGNVLWQVQNFCNSINRLLYRLNSNEALFGDLAIS